MSYPFRFIETTRRTEELLRQGLGLVPLSIDSDLTQAEGSFRGSPVTIETRVYEGPLIRFARFAFISGTDLEIGNVLCLSRPEVPLPILGADLVALSSSAAMLAVDLSPVLPNGSARSAQLAPLASRRSSHPSLPPGGELPNFCVSWFSPYALYTRFGLDAVDAAHAAYLDFPLAFVEIAGRRGASPPHPDISETEVRALQTKYLADHRTEDKGLRMLGKMFGDEWAMRYVGRVLFPEDLVEGIP